MGKTVNSYSYLKITCPACGTELNMSKSGRSLGVDDSKVIKKEETAKKKKSWLQELKESTIIFIRNVVEVIGWVAIFAILIIYIYLQLTNQSELHFKF